jgi:hypothetical protein
MKYISNKLNIRYSGGWPKDSSPSPDYGKGCLDSPAWDWLNLYFYEFCFDKDKIHLSVFLQCDTGSWDTGVSPIDIKNDVKKYEKPGMSKSRLVFVIRNTDFWDIDALLDDKYWRNDSDNEFIIGDNENGKMICKAFNLNEFQNENMTKESINNFIKYIKRNGINELNVIEDL